jgi:hypothetical protein
MGRVGAKFAVEGVSEANGGQINHPAKGVAAAYTALTAERRWSSLKPSALRREHDGVRRDDLAELPACAVVSLAALSTQPCA